VSTRIDVLFNLAARSYFNWLEDVTRDEWDRARKSELDFTSTSPSPHCRTSRPEAVWWSTWRPSTRRSSFKILPSLAHTTNTAGIIGMTRQLALNTPSISCWFSFARSGRV
jgi:hypothetical protein